MRSIKTKLIAIYAAVVLVVMTVSGTFMLLTVRNMEVEHTHDALVRYADRIYEQIILAYEPAAFSGADAWMLFGVDGYEVEGAILNDVGLVMAPWEFFQAEMRFNDASVLSAMAGTESFNQGMMGISLRGGEYRWFTYARPVVVNGETFIIYTRLNMRFMNESLSRLTFTLVLTVLIALIVTMLFWFFLGSTLTNPILALTRIARAIASGDFSRKITIESKDEIGQLAYDFNYMAQELKSTLAGIASEKNKLEVLMQTTSHGVLAYDAKGGLIHANNACGELLHGVDFAETTAIDAFKLLGFATQEILDLKPGQIRESVYEEEEFYLYACITPYTGRQGEVEGYVIILQDITRQQKLDNMRKEFVANVSHELRTPLTNIKTYSETLLNGAIDDRETALQFLKVIDDESARMSLLVSDLLELSRIDSKHTALEMDVLDLAALLRLAIRQAEITAENKNQKIAFTPPEKPCFIEANASRINQVITNIISNSIKYSGENTTIKITMETTEKYYRVFFQDQGMGIPEESLSRIFERFYRVDKARARVLGGTGLGLAIVKEIMEEHGGKVHASSTPGKGTTMVLRFKRLPEDI